MADARPFSCLAAILDVVAPRYFFSWKKYKLCNKLTKKS